MALHLGLYYKFVQSGGRGSEKKGRRVCLGARGPAGGLGRGAVEVAVILRRRAGGEEGSRGGVFLLRVVAGNAGAGSSSGKVGAVSLRRRVGGSPAAVAGRLRGRIGGCRGLMALNGRRLCAVAILLSIGVCAAGGVSVMVGPGGAITGALCGGAAGAGSGVPRAVQRGTFGVLDPRPRLRPRAGAPLPGPLALAGYRLGVAGCLAPMLAPAPSPPTINAPSGLVSGLSCWL